MINNRRVRVFVSSTFSDMSEERDELMTHTWPELRRFCHERDVELAEVDLRWGIPEEQSTRRETIKLCLDEIRACRPFFIGLLGERYGWTPGDDAFTADLKEEQPWLKDLGGKSITELEIRLGVLNNPDMASRAFFYFRNQDYARTRGAGFLAEDAAAAKKQAALKNLVRETCAKEQIPLREDYPDPHRLAVLVLEDLKAAIADQFTIEGIPDPVTREARDHEAFAEIRRRTYIDRPDYFAILDRYATSDGLPLVLLGASGGGKSALLANWVEHWRNQHPGDCVFQHYIGSTPDSAGHWRLMSRLIAEIKRWSGTADEVPRAHDALLRDFPVWLTKARNAAARGAVRFIVVLDALNQLEDRDHARLLNWLPSDAFTGPLRLIVSMLPVKSPEHNPQTSVDDPIRVVMDRGWQSLRIEPLTPDERRRMIADYLVRFGKKLDTRRLERLALAPAAGNPLYLKILLDELRVTGTHDRLDQRLDEYLAAPDIPALLKLVLTRFERDYERDRSGLVSESLGLIWAARRGLSEFELLRLLKPADLPQLPVASWSPLRAALEEGLVDRGGILNFGHDFLRTAVEAAFASANGRQDELRLQLADYFEQQFVSARSCDELPWLLHQSEQNTRLRKCLLDVDRFLEIHARDTDELIHYWVALGEERVMGRNYQLSFDQWSKQPERYQNRVSFAANELAFFLQAAGLPSEAEQLLRCALTIEEQSNPKHAAVAVRLNNLARSLQLMNRLDEAETMYHRAVAISEQSLGSEHSTVAIHLSNLAGLLKNADRLAEAEPLYCRALAIHERNFGPEHPHVAKALNNLAALYGAWGRHAEAEPLFKRSLAVAEKALGPEHPEVALSLGNLAASYCRQERYAEAEPLDKRCLDIREKVLGAEHPSTAVSLNNLAILYFEQRRYAEAEPLMRRALAIWEKAHGPDHPQVHAARESLESILGIAAHFERTRNKVRLTMREAALETYQAGDYRRSEDLLRSLIANGFELPSTHCHLSRILLIEDRHAEAVTEIVAAWELRNEAPAYVVPRILWLQLTLLYIAPIEAIGMASAGVVLGRLKTALARDDAHMEWAMDHVLAHLRPRLRAEQYQLLSALVAALNDATSLPALEEYADWRDAHAEPLG